MLVSRGSLKARAARSCAGSALGGEPRARRAGRAFVVALVGHLEHLFPQGPRLVPLAGGVERSGQLVGGAVAARVALQDLAEASGSGVRVVTGVQTVEAPLHLALPPS